MNGSEMKGSFRRYFVHSMVLIVALTFPSLSFGQTALSQKCMDVMDAMRYAMDGVDPRNLAYSLQKDKQTYFILIYSKVDLTNKTVKGFFSPWRLLERQGESLVYCLIAAGERVEGLLSMHLGTNPQKKYGMPGSGNQRCSDGRNVSDRIDVRLWANKELGESHIMFFHSDISEKDFTFLISNVSPHWILIDHQKSDLPTACYYARGDNVAFRSDFKAP